jgi:hypothetical protein
MTALASLFPDEARPYGKGREFCGSVHTDFAHDPAPVEFHGFHGNTQHLRNFFVPSTLGNELKHLPLAVCQFD